MYVLVYVLVCSYHKKRKGVNMKLTREQQATIERGYAMLYVTPNGDEYYIEHVLNYEGLPSVGYLGKVYAFDSEGDMLDPRGDLSPFDSLEAAKTYLDGLGVRC